MKKYLCFASLSIVTLYADDHTTIDFSSANFQAAVQRAAQQALQYEIDDAEWYARHAHQNAYVNPQYDQDSYRIQAPQWDPGM